MTLEWQVWTLALAALFLRLIAQGIYRYVTDTEELPRDQESATGLHPPEAQVRVLRR